jgi:hypothetical protein
MSLNQFRGIMSIAIGLIGVADVALEEWTRAAVAFLFAIWLKP